MSDEERIRDADSLRTLRDSHGGKLLIAYLQDIGKSGWEQFIALQPEFKTKECAYHFQALYTVSRDIQNWLDTEIRMGDDLKRRKERSQPALAAGQRAGLGSI